MGLCVEVDSHRETTLRPWWRKVLGGFMACLGLVVVVQLLQEHKAGRKRTLRRWWTSPLGFDPLPVLSFYLGTLLKW